MCTNEQAAILAASRVIPADSAGLWCYRVCKIGKEKHNAHVGFSFVSFYPTVLLSLSRGEVKGDLVLDCSLPTTAYLFPCWLVASAEP